MRKPVVLITGANGEIGHALVANLVEQRHQGVVSLDVNALDPHVARLVHREVTGSILDVNLLERILSEFEVDLIFHLAALLSTRSEFTPMAAHHVNVEGTLNLLEFAAHETESHGRPVVFVYPSSIAAYGLPDLETRSKAGRVREDDWNKPITMYGCNKLYCEHLGRYYSNHYKQLLEAKAPRVDFRCVRFPGLISALTLPSGRDVGLRVGDDSRRCTRRGVRVVSFGPTRGFRSWRCRTRSMRFSSCRFAQPNRLSATAYNVRAFNPSADEIRASALRAFPDARITYKVDAKRQAIVDSWPEDVDDTSARRDWDFAPAYDFDRAFHEYLIPTIRATYEGK